MLFKFIAATWFAAICSSPFVHAQETPAVTATQTQVLSKLDSKISGICIRASKLTGMKLQNSKGESVGQINDLVVNPTTQRIQYVAVTYGGFLGMGDKMFAVPMHAIQVKADPDNQGQVLLVLDVTKEQMKGAEGFDEAHWPDFSNDSFAGEIHKRYGVLDQLNRDRVRDGKVEVRFDRTGAAVGVEVKK
jgi:sporulation protein YlmC with PRC-barrel domain